MEILNLTAVLPARDLGHELAFWERVLDIAPAFVDGDRWAQFDVGGHRLALSGADRVADSPAMMLKVGDLANARSRLGGSGIEVGPVEDGPHERRCALSSPTGWTAVLYESA